nr:MAG TPA: hypothetical protein [Caudoviricetes sp.]
MKLAKRSFKSFLNQQLSTKTNQPQADGLKRPSR